MRLLFLLVFLTFVSPVFAQMEANKGFVPFEGDACVTQKEVVSQMLSTNKGAKVEITTPITVVLSGTPFAKYLAIVFNNDSCLLEFSNLDEVEFELIYKGV
jgi:hypothetical protein